MYSYEQKMKAVELFIKYGYCQRMVIGGLGYPSSRNTLKAWHNEYLKNNNIDMVCTRKSKYSKQEQEVAITYYLDNGRCVSKTLRDLGYSSQEIFEKWLQEANIKKKNVL